MKIRFILFLVLSGTFGIINGQPTAIDRIDEYLTQYKNRIPIPGFSIVIVEADKVLFSKGYGVEKEGFTKAMTPQTSVGIGSVGRGFTAMAVMQLVESGRLDLDEPVTTYLPWFKTANKQFSDEITVRMCLNNTSGIPPQNNFTADLDPTMAPERFVRSLEGYYVKRKPGRSHEFCDEGYSIAGLIIAELSGMTYPEFMAKNIFEKLGMTRTTTDPAKFEALNVSYGHETGLDKCIPAAKELVNTHFLPAGVEMRSSSADLGHYLIALLNGGKYKNNQILSPKSVEELFKANTSFRGLGTMLGGNGIDIQYALGWMGMVIEDRNIMIHTGNTGTMAAIVGLNKEKNQGIAMLFNGDVNRLDRYVYPTLENTANNVIHLLNNEATTDFAVVRFDDPFDDDYTLPQEKWGAYLGNYMSYGKTNPLFKDINIEIVKGESQEMELIAKKSGVIKGHYRLQFINESRAVLRSIAHPREIQFKLYPNGSIGGLYMFGSEFKKRGDILDARFSLEHFPEQSVSFLFPKSAKKEWTGKASFNATFSENPGIRLSMSIAELGSETFENFVNNQIKENKILTRGTLKNVAVRDGIWTEQSIAVKEDGKDQQLLFIFYQDPISGKQAQILLRNPWGAFTSELQETIMYMQKTVTFLL